MMKLSAIKDNTIRIKILGGTDSSAYSAVIDFGAFEKTVDSFENDIAEIEVTAAEVQSLETPRVFARMEIINDGKVIDTELVEVMKWYGEVTKRELYLYATVVQSVCPINEETMAAMTKAETKRKKSRTTRPNSRPLKCISRSTRQKFLFPKRA